MIIKKLPRCGVFDEPLHLFLRKDLMEYAQVGGTVSHLYFKGTQAWK